MLRPNVSLNNNCWLTYLISKDPSVLKATGKTDPVDVMGKLREMKNNM